MPYYPQQPYQTQQPYGQPRQAYPPQAPVPQYPYRNPAQPYPPQQPHYVQPQMSPEEYQQYTYQRQLRRTANSIGTLMLIFFGLELVLGVIVTLVTYFVNGKTATESDPLYLLENGMLSSLIFFVSALIYCLIRRVRFAEILPFDKISGSLLTKLCVIGLSFSLMSNYVVDMLNNSFGLFGIENSGGSFDIGSEPNILLYFLTVAILPAFAEEFAFRGVVMGILRPYSEGLAILVSSATFALMHGNFVQLPFTFCCGLVFAYIDVKTNSLLPSIIVHFLNNALSVLCDVLVSYGVINETGGNILYGIIFAVTGILSFIFLKGIISKDGDSFFKLNGSDDVIPFKRKVKTAASSPTLIAYSAVMITYCILMLLPTGWFS